MVVAKNPRKKIFKLILLFISILFLLVLFKIFTPWKDFFYNPCEERVESFTFAGCRVTYKDYEKTESCHPCSNCDYGFDHNKQVAILQCLCKSERTDAAKKFGKEYLKTDQKDACQEIPEKKSSIFNL